MNKEQGLTEQIIGAASEVHNYWGPGRLESMYEKSMAHELVLRGVAVQRQVRLDLKYKDMILDDESLLSGKTLASVKIDDIMSFNAQIP